MAKKRCNAEIVAAAEKALEVALNAQAAAVEHAKRGIAATEAARDEVMEQAERLRANMKQQAQQHHDETKEQLNELAKVAQVKGKSIEGTENARIAQERRIHEKEFKAAVLFDLKSMDRGRRSRRI